MDPDASDDSSLPLTDTEMRKPPPRVVKPAVQSVSTLTSFVKSSPNPLEPFDLSVIPKASDVVSMPPPVRTGDRYWRIALQRILDDVMKKGIPEKSYASPASPVVWADPSKQFCVVKDVYPKSRTHLLILPFPKLKMPERVGLLTPHHLPHLCAMRDIAVALLGTSTFQPSAPPITDAIVQPTAPLVGFHAVPSLPPLHCHVLSPDLEGRALKTKKHRTSFQTSFFIPLDEVIQILRGPGGGGGGRDSGVKGEVRGGEGGTCGGGGEDGNGGECEVTCQEKTRGDGDGDGEGATAWAGVDTFADAPPSKRRLELAGGAGGGGVVQGAAAGSGVSMRDGGGARGGAAGGGAAGHVGGGGGRGSGTGGTVGWQTALRRRVAAGGRG